MYDWDHTVDTPSPDYYRWTQWLFLQLYKAGLAVKKEAPVNWCPSCNTVLANEQVVGGLCERCDTPVEMRNLSQWFFRITDYAPRLLDNLDWIDWSETTRKAQENWIGRSEGAKLRFPLARRKASEERHEPATLHPERPVVEVFTTRPDTVFGATYMVLAPEHPLVAQVTTDDDADDTAEPDAHDGDARVALGGVGGLDSVAQRLIRRLLPRAHGRQLRLRRPAGHRRARRRALRGRRPAA